MGQVQRRRFLIGGSALLATQLARAQSERDRVRTIGYLSLAALDPKVPPREGPTSKALKKLGWIEGQNMVIERRFADLKREPLAGLAQELVRKRVEVILAAGALPAVEAGRATKSIPIVFFEVSLPVEMGLVDSLSRPGRNLTGTSWFADTGVSTKRLEFLREIAPAAKRLSHVGQVDRNERLTGEPFDMPAVWEAAAKRLGFEFRRHDVQRVGDIDRVFAEIVDWRADAVNWAGGDYLVPARERIAEFGRSNRLPSVFAAPSLVEAGGLLSYSPAAAEWTLLIERSAEYVDRILRGAQPAELPVAAPTKYELLLNTKTAKALGLTIPQAMRLRADRVIE